MARRKKPPRVDLPLELLRNPSTPIAVAIIGIGTVGALANIEFKRTVAEGYGRARDAMRNMFSESRDRLGRVVDTLQPASPPTPSEPMPSAAPIPQTPTVPTLNPVAEHRAELEAKYGDVAYSFRTQGIGPALYGLGFRGSPRDLEAVHRWARDLLVQPLPPDYRIIAEVTVLGAYQGLDVERIPQNATPAAATPSPPIPPTAPAEPPPQEVPVVWPSLTEQEKRDLAQKARDWASEISRTPAETGTGELLAKILRGALEQILVAPNTPTTVLVGFFAELERWRSGDRATPRGVLNDRVQVMRDVGRRIVLFDLGGAQELVRESARSGLWRGSGLERIFGLHTEPGDLEEYLRTTTGTR